MASDTFEATIHDVDGWQRLAAANGRVDLVMLTSATAALIID